MSKFETIELESGESFDLQIETGFTNPLNVGQITHLIQTIADILATHFAHDLCEGISFLQVTETHLTIRLRYATVESKSAQRLIPSRPKLQFFFFLLAKIDNLYPLSDVPLPEGWQGWLDFPEHIAEFGYERA